MIPPDLQRKLDKVADVIRKAIEKLMVSISAEEKRLARQLLKIIEKLKVDKDGNIRLNKVNLEDLEKIKEILSKFHRTPFYKKLIAAYSRSIFLAADEINVYYAATIAKFNAEKKLYKQVLNKSIKRVERELTSSGVSAQISREVRKAIRPNAKTGLIRKVDLEARIEKLMLAKEGGVVQRAVKRIAHDALYMQVREYEKTLTQDLGFRWYLYAGSAIATSRKFCRERHDKFFHVNEILSWEKLNWDGKKTAKYGKVDIFVDCGGFNCRHLLSGVVESYVPESAKKQAFELGYLN